MISAISVPRDTSLSVVHRSQSTFGSHYCPYHRISITESHPAAVQLPISSSTSRRSPAPWSCRRKVPTPCQCPSPSTTRGTNQDSCQGTTFNFTYSGSATYTEVYATSTTSLLRLNPSLLGQSVTYTATVTANPTAGQDPVPSSPTGSVTFMDGDIAIPSCSNVAIVSTTHHDRAGHAARLLPTPPPVPMTSPLNYTNSDGNFSNSTSPVFPQVVA